MLRPVRWWPFLPFLLLAALATPPGRSVGGSEPSRDPLPRGALARFRAPGEVYAVALSTDGRLAATAGAPEGRPAGRRETAIRLWDTTSGKPLRSWLAPEQTISAIMFAPGGRMLAAGGPEWTIRRWDVPTGKPRGDLTGHADTVSALIFSLDGKLLASAATRDRTVYLWDPTAGRELCQLGGRTRVLAVAFTADGKSLSSVAADGLVRRYQLPAGRLAGELPVGGQGPWSVAAIYPDTQVLAAVAWDGAVVLWDLEAGRPLGRLQRDEMNALGLAFSPDGSVLAGFDKTSLRLWEPASGQVVAEFDSHPGMLRGIAFSGDGRTLASACADGTVLLWDMTLGAAQASPEFGPKELDRLWSNLGATDAPLAQHAAWTLAAVPDKAVPFLRERLQAAAPSDPKSVRKLIADLDDDAFAVRENASRELRALGARAEPTLREVLRGQPSAEVRRRVRELLASLEGRDNQVRGYVLGQLRAVQALERVGTPDARQVLEMLARRDSSTRLTRDARAAMERVDRRPKGGR